MNKKEYKNELYKVFDMNVEGFNKFEDKMNYIENILIEYQKDNEDKREIENKGKKWTDEELKIILSDAPSKKNCMKYAVLFSRGYGSIEQIYRWSTTQDKKLSTRRKEDSFIQQIKKVAKELGLRG